MNSRVAIKATSFYAGHPPPPPAAPRRPARATIVTLSWSALPPEIKLDSVGPLAAAKKVSPERSPSPPSYEQPLSGFGSGDPLTDKSTETFAAMSAIFEGYEKELLELNSAITRKAASIPTLTRGTRLHPSACPRALGGSCARPTELSYSACSPPEWRL